jgi:redox-sensitive bicupin YhaK (pirin superfamily)
MGVPPHPHIGLQTVSWLITGLVHHTDSIGSDCLVAPGHVGLMTAGRGIAHAERSPKNRPPILHGVQLWVALPSSALQVAPAFQHVEAPPQFTHEGVIGTVIIGSYAGLESPATAYTPIVGVDFDIPGNERTTLPLRPDFEYAVLVTKGYVAVEDHPMKQGEMVYLGCGRESFEIESELGARVVLLGGEPFAEEIVMWWNFVGRTHEDIEQARTDWMNASERFGAVVDIEGPLPAPPIPSVRLKPRGRKAH